ncbi:Protein kinase domain [Arabidopsis suecica]|uniref:Protein kinase domain n=1 Tax=Arabidopsis suecica TaxID=45249 RepID=A0A8T2B7Y2_ARASU|nr:Protein kinase domain [Arabidopsis suecica]
MDWWKKNMSRAVVKKERLARGQRRGEMFLKELIQCCDGKTNPIKFFSADQILKATERYFCKCNILERSQNVCECSRISELVFQGKWYSGTLDSRRMIIVKKMLGRSPNPPRDICSGPPKDIAISSMVSGHKNFMKLVGCCLEFEYPVLVYYGKEKQYSPIDLKVVVSWRRRMKIAEEVATALAYLHNAFPRPFVYRNMGFKNILLDEDGVAKLIDLSYCVSIPKGETFVKLTWAGRDYDYMDDNYLFNKVVSEKTDAFGFGIFMQKLLTGEERFDELCGWKNWRGKNKVPKWLSKSMGEGRMDEIIDPNMLKKMDEVSEEERCLMEVFLNLSERCIGLRGEVPNMVQVAKELKRSRKTASSSSGETRI